MLKGRGRDPRAGMPVTPAHLAARPPAQAHLTVRGLVHRAPLAKAEPDYEVVEFPSEQYVNAKLQPPPPPPPRPPTGHPADAGASCGLCGGGGARVRCAECGRRALCASCDDMYHRHPKRRHHQRQALPPSQLRDELPPLPPKVTPPVPPPRRHKLGGDRSSASPRPSGLEQRRATLGHMTLPSQHQPTNKSLNNNATVHHPIPAHLQRKLAQQPTAGHPNHLGMQSPVGHVGSMPYLNMPHAAPMAQSHAPAGTLGHLSAAWGQPRGSLTPFNMHQNVVNTVPSPAEAWESPDSMSPPGHASPWGRPLRRGASVLELGAGGVVCGGCAHCSAAAPAWRYGSCASLDHAWPGAWPHAPPHPPPCCQPQHPHNMHAHQHGHTPQPYRRVDSRAVSRAASRPCSRAASPAASVRSRASRRARHRTPSPPPLPSSDADSESDSDSPPHNRDERRISHSSRTDTKREPSLGPAPPPPAAAWHCEHCTYVNEPGVRVCAVCCRTPTAAPNFTANVNVNMSRLRVADNDSPSPVPTAAEEPRAKQNGEATKQRPVRERASTGCGPSPPREETPRKPVNRLVTPTREPEQARTRHDMAVGPSPPRDHNMATGPSPPREPIPVRASPYRELQRSPPAPPTRHSVSVGPSPPRDTTLRPTVSMQVQKKSTGTSPPREAVRETPPSTRANVSNTGTSPPPQSISTQTYEAGGGVGAGPGVGWERAPSASRSRPRRRPRDPARRERSHSRHSLSSDTRESERSVRTSVGGGGSSGRWEWRETRDSSPGGEWSDGERRRLTRRASHLDLRRARQPAARRASFYGSEAASPEPLSSTRTLSLEALAGAGARREAERGLELARLMTDAERLGFSAAEVHAALAQNPTAPLSWLRERWPSLCAGVRAAAARLAPGVAVTELEARAALARHRGAMWPAVTECVERHRRQVEAVVVGEEGRLRGRVWGSPAGADDDAAPPARRTHRAREDSSDEFEATTPNKLRDDDWMYLPLEPSVPNPYDIEPNPDVWSKPQSEIANGRDDIANKLKSFLIQAGVPSIDENLLLKGLLADSTVFNTGRESNDFNENYLHNKPQPNDLVQSEIDFIDAYNALTRLSPLPNIKNPLNLAQISKTNGSLNLRQEERSLKDLHRLIYNREKHNEIASKNNFRSNQSQEQLNLKVPDLNKLEGRQQDNEPKEIESATDLHVEEHAVIVNRNVRDEQPKTRSRENTPKENIPNTTKRELVPHTVIANNRVSPEQSIKKPSTSSNPRNSTNVPENTPKTSHREDERTNNLSDIVDDTQRLIQQMKEEINSDINSLDGRSMSQSEPDNSSNDDLSTEHESSSSESHEETDDISSDENETSGTEEDSKHSKKSGTVVNRTSSEDNEQFEEAMDHIEEQNENFKQTNIEILNSIARSLQEEHTISVRASQTEEPNATQIKETIQSNQSRPPAPKLSKTKVQDLNNNLFAVVNSFEEIYDEINSSSGNEYKNTDQQKTGKIESTERTSTLPQTPRVNIERRDIEILLFTPISPTKLIIDERELPVLNAIIENIEEPLEITEYDSIENHTSNIAENLEGPPNYLLKNNAINAKESDITLVTLNNDHQLDSYSDNIHGNSQYRGFSGNEHNIEDNAHYDSHNVSLVKENGQSLETNNEAHHDINNIIDNRALTDKDNGFDHNEESNMNEQIDHIQEPNLNNSEEIYHIGAKETSKSPEKSISGSSNSGGKISAMAKSSIPKLIRILPNNKQKFDKTPKVIASKMPVRRGSIKQYPAPTPPKTHFGNIQSGLVKQLQTRLFNSKTTKVTANPSTTEEIKSTPSHSATVEVKASTSSTLNKKRPAPQPPSRLQEIKQPSPPQASPPKEKKNYFRETCRTEDEWTESDSEDSQLQIRKGDDEPQRVPSPPPPITLRRVSGQLIDLARVRLLEGSPERQARMLLAEGAAESWEQAQLAVELVSRGADPPAALLAALECADLNAALAYLYQDCELCASRFPEHEMVSMLRCTHRCCRECARHYFTVQVTERSIVDCVCPYCKEPELETLPEDAWLEYFAHLDILLKMLLEVDVHELFQRKLRDRTLARDPNFRWCVECSSGFFVHPKQKKLRCPECKSVSCATCRKPWSSNHEGLSCEQYAAWLEDNDPERSVAAVQQHLRENGLECPRCRFKYSLSRGGCMHFTCTQCKFEFCYGCGKPFMMGARCGLSEYCAKLGLHAHHPRNCLFYLRDKEPHELQTLLQMNDVSYETELAVESGAGGGGGRCPVQLQRETPAGLVDGACGSEVAPKHAGLCKPHYVEYLATRARALDPIPIMEVSELVAELRRRALPLPERGPWDTDPVYAGMCAEIVKEKIPLD